MSALLQEFLANEPYCKAKVMRFSKITEFNPVQHQPKDILGGLFVVHFTPKNRHWLSVSRRPLCATSRHSALRQRLALFDHLVGGVEHRLRYGQVKRFGGFAIDSELDFRGLLERQVGWLLAFQNTSSVDADNAIGVGKVRSVTHQPAGRDKLGQSMDRRHTKACREGSEVIELTVEVWICPDDERANFQFN